jgi:predicted nucleotidyltransferase
MPIVSWHSFEDVSTYNRTLAEALQVAAESALSDHIELLGIWLFGSRARGDIGPRSDVDLLLLTTRAAPRMMDRVLDYPELLGQIPAPVDLLVLTPSELAELRHGPFYQQLFREAKPLACRDNASIPPELPCTISPALPATP